MPKEELNLFQSTATHVTELGAGSAKVMRSKMIQLHPFGTLPNHVPDDVLGDAGVLDAAQGRLQRNPGIFPRLNQRPVER